MKGGKLSRRILYRWMGYHVDVTEPLPSKFIIAMAPHTSNMDFLIGQLYSRSIDTPIQFMMKKFWFFWPLGPILRRMGGIPIDRSRHTGVTEQVAQAAREAETFRLCITPEGTRKPTRDWKKGFYYIALKAELPILLFGLDYERRLIACRKTIVPSGDFEADMAQIKEYFREFRGRHPKNFIV